MTPTWKFVKLSTVFVADSGWHYDDDATITKLVASVQRHGQLQPLVVRGDIEDDTMCTLVEGHKLLGAMLALGMTDAMAVHLGALDADAALRVALALELDFETDYGCMVQAVAGLVERGVTVAELAAGSPFHADRLKHMSTLAKLDWGVFGEDTSQARLDWDALEEPGGVPPMLVLDTSTGFVKQVSEREAAQVVRINPPILDRMVDAAADVIDRTRPDTTPEQVATAMREALEDVTEPAVPAPAEPAAAPQGAPDAPPGKATKAKAAKVPKAPDAQLGLF